MGVEPPELGTYHKLERPRTGCAETVVWVLSGRASWKSIVVEFRMRGEIKLLVLQRWQAHSVGMTIILKQRKVGLKDCCSRHLLSPSDALFSVEWS